MSVGLGSQPCQLSQTQVTDEQFLDNLFDKVVKENYNLDDIMISAVHASKYNGIKTEHL